MTLIIKRLQEVHINLCSPHKPAFILDNNYIVLLFDKFTHKSWIFILKNKDKFFDIFKLWLSRVEANRSQLDCLQTDSRKEFISVILKNFYKEPGIKIEYIVPYIYKENNIVEQY